MRDIPVAYMSTDAAKAMNQQDSGILTFADASKEAVLSRYAPACITGLPATQKTIPKLAKNAVAVADIEVVLPTLPTRHELRQADARELGFLPGGSVHLVLTSCPQRGVGIPQQRCELSGAGNIAVPAGPEGPGGLELLRVVA